MPAACVRPWGVGRGPWGVQQRPRFSRLRGHTLSQGFTGVLCEENIDNCDPDPCHHGQCQDGIDSYTCVCSPGYMGAICSDQVDECHSDPCLHEGRCIDLVNGYQCNCQPGTSGEPPRPRACPLPRRRPGRTLRHLERVFFFPETRSQSHGSKHLRG